MGPSPQSEHSFSALHSSSTSLDDIFDPSPTHTLNPSHSTLANEPSELPVLRRQHVTAGYRDGISIAKSEHVQRGFDVGFPVGAVLGIRAGVVLGILEGLVACSAVSGGEFQERYV